MRAIKNVFFKLRILAPGTRRAWFSAFSAETEAVAEPEVARPGAQKRIRASIKYSIK